MPILYQKDEQLKKIEDWGICLPAVLVTNIFLKYQPLVMFDILIKSYFVLEKILL